MSRALIAGIAGAATFLLGTGSAAAATFYAEPGGDGPFPCVESNPCSLLNAADYASDGDEVVALPGLHDLGSEYIELNFDTDVHGLPGEDTVVRTSGGIAIWVVQGDSRIADLRLEAPTGQPLISAFGNPTFERLVAIGGHSTATACSAPISPGVIRDTLCVNTAGGPALGFSAFSGGPLSWSFDIVNVTAVATGGGAEANGMEFEASGGLTMSVAATNSIASGGGTTADVRATNSGSGAVSVVLDRSNFDLVDQGANTSITPAGQSNNQTAAPDFVDEGDLDFRQALGSATVDAGTDVPLLGTLDFEGQPRIDGSAPDIGGDEFDEHLRLKVKAKKKQKAKKLKVKVKCPEEECTVFAKGRAKAADEKFKLKKTKERSLEAGERRKLKLKARNLDELMDLLADSDGKARIKVKGTDAAGNTARKKESVTLVG